MNGVKLSVCIATLNRADFIGATLESILSQTQGSREVEVVVLDGASRDNTPEVVGRFQAKHPSLRYFRMDSNKGVDEDFDKTVELAQGDYCWLMSDDDLLKPGAIPAVLQAIERNPSLVIVNAEVRTVDLSRLLEAKRLKMDADRSYGPEDNERLFVDTAKYLSFIGCVVVSRELWCGRERKKYFGTEFIHMGVLFQSPLPRAALVLHEPWITIRYGNALWTGRKFEIGMFKWPDLIWSFSQFSDSAKSKICRREPWRQWPRLLFYRALGAFSVNEYTRWIQPRVRPGWRRFLVKKIAEAPLGILNALGIFCFSVFFHLSRLPLDDLKSSRLRFRKAS